MEMDTGQMESGISGVAMRRRILGYVEGIIVVDMLRRIRAMIR